MVVGQSAFADFGKIVFIFQILPPLWLVMLTNSPYQKTTLLSSELLWIQTMPVPVSYMVWSVPQCDRSHLWHPCLNYSWNPWGSCLQESLVCPGYKTKIIRVTWPVRTWILKTIFIYILMPTKSDLYYEFATRGHRKLFPVDSIQKSSPRWLWTSPTHVALPSFVGVLMKGTCVLTGKAAWTSTAQELEAHSCPAFPSCCQHTPHPVPQNAGDRSFSRTKWEWPLHPAHGGVVDSTVQVKHS